MSREADDAFQVWAVGCRASLRRTAFLLSGDWHLADDLLQDTLLRVYGAWGRLAGTGDVTGYARRVLVNRFFDHRRRPARRETATAEVPDRADPAASAAMEAGVRLLLLAALREVPASQRAVLVLRLWEDLSVEQTASLLGCSAGTVKSQTHRGLASLRTALAQRGLEGSFDLMEQP